MSKEEIIMRRAKRAAFAVAFDYDNATDIAEEIAIEAGHDEWLDDPDHEIWEWAMDAFEAAHGEVA